MRIAVCGAGYTGLAAAMRLADAGYDVELLEKGDDIGGLAGDFTMHGVHVEKAYHFLYQTDMHIQAFMAELGMEGEIVWCESNRCCFYRGKIYPFDGALDLIKFTPIPFLDRIRAGLTVLLLQKTRMGWKKLSRITAYDWLKQWAGPKVLEVIWAPLLKGKFDRYYKEISMQWLWGRIMQRADSQKPGDKCEKLGQIKGGFHRLTQAMADRIRKANCPIHLNRPVASFKQRPDGRIDVVSPDGEADTFDKVLFTGPSPVFGDMVAGNDAVPQEYVDNLKSIPYLGAIVHIFSSDQEITPYYWHNISEMDWPFLVLINLTKLRDKADFAGKHIYYLAAYVPHEHEYFTMPQQELFDLWYGALAEMWPKFDRGQLLEEHLFRFKYAQHIVGLRYDRKIPPYESPIEGLYLSNFSQIYPLDRGTNLAINEGDKVAKMIMQSAGKPQP